MASSYVNALYRRANTFGTNNEPVKSTRFGRCLSIFTGILLLTLFILFLIATVLEFSSGGDRFEEKLEFRFLAYLTVPMSILLLTFGIFLCLSCQFMDRGCFISHRTKHYHQPGNELSYRSIRALEWFDFLSDIASTIIIFNDFDSVYQTILSISLVMTFILNTILQISYKRNNTWWGRKQRIAVSFALMGAEDILIVPLNILYLDQEIKSDNLNDLQIQIETIAVGLSTALGIILLVYRTSALVYHISCSLPDAPVDDEVVVTTSNVIYSPKVKEQLVPLHSAKKTDISPPPGLGYLEEGHTATADDQLLESVKRRNETAHVPRSTLPGDLSNVTF